MGEERRIERLEFELAEAGTDILDLRKQLAEARAEIERQTDRIMSDACIISAAALAIAERDKLIEQMREALRELESNHGGLSDHNYNIVKAALEAAERGGNEN